MRKFLKLLTFFGAVSFTSGLMAGTCEIQYDRTACPGKEAISYKKCDGEKTCSEFKEAASVAECRTIATSSCSNSRFSITKSKVVNAVFDDQPITTDSGKSDFCEEYDKRDQEFNQC